LIINRPLPDPPAKVMEILLKLAGAGHTSFVVGGAVRDLLMGRPVQDWDVATSASPAEVSALFPRVIATGARHGTVTVRLGGQNVEVTSFRGKSILEDLSHRDFTIDAMAYDPQNKAILDPHRGIHDAGCRLLRAVGDPRERLGEDPLRALRAVRLAAELDLRVEPELLAGLREAGQGLQGVARERIREELNRILLVREPSKPLRLLDECGLMERIIPELGCSGGFSQLPWVLEAVDLVPERICLRWAALLLGLDKGFSPLNREGPQESMAKGAVGVLLRLRLSRRQAEHAGRILHHHAIPHRDSWPWEQVRGLIFQMGPELIQDAILLRKASLVAVRAHPRLLSCLDELREKVQGILSNPSALEKMRPVLKGEDVMGLLGLEPGPEVGEVLRALQEAVLRAPALNNREALTKWLLNREAAGTE
jgi:tRNA nucleotidyltransferase/poly(A) polymerase